MRPNIKVTGIIHLFALLHAGVALVCRTCGIDDELFLTVLTMAMSIIICMKRGLKIEFTAAIVIFVNILGFLLGTFGAKVLQSFISSDLAVHALSTLITTEILGWCIIAMTNVFKYKAEILTISEMASSHGIRNISAENHHSHSLLKIAV